MAKKKEGIGKPDSLTDEQWAEVVHKAYIERSANSLMLFLNGLKIDGASGPVFFNDDMMAPFQKETFSSLAPSLEAVQRGEMPERRRFWIERTKKAGKDSDIAACLLWLLAFPKRFMNIQVGAADQEQASIVRRRIDAIVYYNPWLLELVQISKYKISSVSGMVDLDIMAADTAGAHGATPDVLVINELSHVNKWEFIQNLLENANGVPQGVVIIATNAGVIGTQAHTLKQKVEANPRWSCHYWKQPAPWISEDDVNDAKSVGPESRYKMYWEGEWVSGKGDAFTSNAIDKVFCLEGPAEGPEKGWRYIAGLDLGVSYDHSGFVVLGVNADTQKIRVVYFNAWKPSKNEKVQIPEVEEVVEAVCRKFRVEWIGYDAHQAVMLAQRLARKGFRMSEITFGGRNLVEMADCMLQVVSAGKLESYDDEKGRMRRDLGKLDLRQKSYGYRLDAVSDETGHADIATALIIAIPRAVQMMDTASRLMEDEPLFWNEEASQDEIDEMPDDLRQIYEEGNTDIGGFGGGLRPDWEDEDDEDDF